MSTAKHSRASGSGSSDAAKGTKLPKFLQKAQTIAGRDRSKSVSQAPSPDRAASPPPHAPPETPKTSRGSRFIRARTVAAPPADASPSPSPELPRTISPSPTMDSPADLDTPVIVEPALSPPPRQHPSLAPPLSSAQSIPVPRPHTRSERVHIPGGSGSVSDSAAAAPHLTVAASPTRTTGGITDLSSRLSGWFSHTFSSSTTDLTLPGILAQSTSSSASPSSPSSARGAGKASALLTAAKHGKGHLDKAMRYLLDSDATPDRCEDPIWLLGVQHPGYEPPPPPPSFTPVSVPMGAGPTTPGRRTSSDRRSPTFRAASSTSTSGSGSASSHSHSHASASTSSLTAVPPPPTPAGKSSSAKHDPAALWPPVFYADFSSRVWVTYRSHFQPIRDTTLTALEAEVGEAAQAGGVSGSPSSGRRWWGGEKGWTSDAGWGCMLRTGQSLLANALLHMHLGRGTCSSRSVSRFPC
jgi:cysteine protease ATG4